MKKEDNFSCLENIWFDKKENDVNFTVNVEGEQHVFTEGVSFTVPNECWWSSNKRYDFGTLQNNKKDVKVTVDNMNIEVTEHYEFFNVSSAVRMCNTVENIGEKSIELCNFTSGKLNISYDEPISIADEERFRIHYVKSGWATEAQWKEGSFIDLGMSPCRDEFTGTIARFTLRSEGSWSTGRYYPILILEDKEKNKSYFIEHEGAYTWEISIGKWGKEIVLEAGSADFHHDGWHKCLENGEKYTTTKVLLGTVNGGIEEAIKELIKAKRESSLVKTDTVPLCYNVYMGGIWGEPNDKNLVPLIDACKELGVEAFCIDAGWYRPEKDTSKYNLLGDYIPDEKRFGEMKLDGVLKYMQDSGMIPGLWFEFEATNIAMNGSKNGEAMVKRNGKIISEQRGFYDLRDEKVREHLFNAVDRVYKMGMRFIKNDYNFSTGIGIGDKDYNEENKSYISAFYGFIDELYKRYPDLIIENCGSGGMRSDNETLSHFLLQSTSDQERYYNYPTISAGSIGIMPPEKAGIWVYPYAAWGTEYWDLLNGGSPEALLEREDRKEPIVFNMVNGMLGSMYLSGRLDLMSDENKHYIKEAIEIFKKNRKFIANAYPCYPTGFGAMGRRQFVTAGLLDENKTEMKLCVWKQNAKEDTISVDLSKYTDGGAKVTLTYPADTEYSLENNVLTLTLKEEKYMARYFEIKL